MAVPLENIHRRKLRIKLYTIDINIFIILKLYIINVKILYVQNK